MYNKALSHTDPTSRSTFFYLTPFVLFAFIVPALGGILFGFEIGSTSVVVLTLQNRYPDVADDSTNQFVKGMFTSSGLLGALLGAIIAFRVGDWIGCKKVMILSALTYSIGSLVSALGSSLELIIAGKLIFGVGIGFSMHSAPVYISEMSPPPVRGLLISMKEALIVIGMVLGKFVGFVFCSGDEWRLVFASGGALSVVFGVGLLFLPETVRYLLTTGNESQARQSLEKLRNFYATPTAIEEEFEEIKSTMNTKSLGSFRALSKSSKQVVVAVGIVVLQQVTGQPTVLYYSTKLLTNAVGNSNSQIAAVATWVAVVKFLATCVSVVFVDKLGRRVLLVVGAGGMGLCMFGLAYAFHYFGDETNILTIVVMMGYVAFYQVGFGPISWLLISEIFPGTVRARAVALSVFINFGTNLSVTFSFPMLVDQFSEPLVFTGFGCLCVFACVFVLVTLPETKGKSLEQIENLFYPNRNTALHETLMKPGQPYNLA